MPADSPDARDDVAPQDLSAVAWPVRTARLTLRPATAADAGPTHRIRSLPGVSHWLTRLPGPIEQYTEGFLSPTRLARTLVVELEGVVVGDLMLTVGDAWAQAEVADRAVATQAELGWVVDPRYAGRGLATEAAEELLRICFEDLGLRRATALCFADHAATRRVMEKVGMRCEELTRRESLHRSGQWLDGAGYAILADEWRERQLLR